MRRSVSNVFSCCVMLNELPRERKRKWDVWEGKSESEKETILSQARHFLPPAITCRHNVDAIHTRNLFFEWRPQSLFPFFPHFQFLPLLPLLFSLFSLYFLCLYLKCFRLISQTTILLFILAVLSFFYLLKFSFFLRFSGQINFVVGICWIFNELKTIQFYS